MPFPHKEDTIPTDVLLSVIDDYIEYDTRLELANWAGISPDAFRNIVRFKSVSVKKADKVLTNLGLSYLWYCDPRLEPWYA